VDPKNHLICLRVSLYKYCTSKHHKFSAGSRFLPAEVMQKFLRYIFLLARSRSSSGKVAALELHFFIGQIQITLRKQAAMGLHFSIGQIQILRRKKATLKLHFSRSSSGKLQLWSYISPSDRSRSSSGKSPTSTVLGFTNPPYFS
jgi:hypothetical protein